MLFFVCVLSSRDFCYLIAVKSTNDTSGVNSYEAILMFATFTVLYKTQIIYFSTFHVAFLALRWPGGKPGAFLYTSPY